MHETSPPSFSALTTHGDGGDRSVEWETLRRRHLRTDRPDSSARGVHHLALLSSDVERTIDFYQGLLEFPLTELFENRDYTGSTHFFFDIGKISVATISKNQKAPASFAKYSTPSLIRNSGVIGSL